jgi:hypothetical protein
MEQIMNNALVIATVLIPLVAGIVEAIKKATEVNTKHLPVIAMITGVVVSFFVSLGFGLPIAELILAGVIAGLGASGLYDNLKGAK